MERVRENGERMRKWRENKEMERGRGSVVSCPTR